MLMNEVVYRRRWSRGRWAVKMDVELAGRTAVEPVRGSDVAADVAGESGGVSIRRSKGEIERMRVQAMVHDQRLDGALDMKIEAASGAVVAESGAVEFAGVAAELGAGVGGNRGEGEWVVGMRRVGDGRRHLRTGEVEGEVGTCFARVDVAGGVGKTAGGAGRR